MRLSSATLLISAIALLAASGSALAQQAEMPNPRPLAESLGGESAVPPALQGEEHANNPAFEQIVDPCACKPPLPWSITADALFLGRTNARAQPLFLQEYTTDQLLGAENLNPRLSVGVRCSAIRRSLWGCELEIGFFQIDGLTANADVPDRSFMVVDSTYSGFVVTQGEAHYTSALRLGELNLRHQCTCLPGVTVLAGFRMGELDEIYRATGIDAFSMTADRVLLTEKTFNHLYGFQVGGEAPLYDAGGPFRIDVLSKVGLFGNTASLETRLADGAVLRAANGDHNQTAFLGELGVRAVYEVNSHLSLRASGDAIWVAGVALAPDQVLQTNLDTGAALVDTRDTVIYYGGSLGLEFKF